MTKIQLVGNQAFSSDALRKQLEIHTVNSFQKIFLRKKPSAFSADVLDNGIERLTRFYQAEGFLRVKIDPALKVDHEHQHVELTLKLQEGEPVRVSKVSTVLIADSSNHRVSLQAIAQRRLADLILQPGMRFRDLSMRADQDSLARSYANVGHPYVKVNFVLDVNQTRNLVGILWQLDAGPLCRFGEVQIDGVNESLAKLVRRNLEFRKGETFNQARLEKSQEWIYGLGIFRIATLQAALGGRLDSTTVPIRVQVKEAPRLKAQIGIGYGTEDHFRAMADLQVLRFPSGARRLNLVAKHSRLEPYNLSLTNTNNSFLARNTSLITSIFFRQQKEEGFNVDRLGGSLTLGRRFGFYTNGYVAYNLETVNDNENANNQTRTADEPANYNKSAIVTGVNLDNSTPIFTPKRGTYASAFFMISGFGFNSVDFYKAVLEIRRYHGVNGGWVFAWRGKIGAAAPYQNNTFFPPEELFYAGGSTSIRGWGRSELGPIDPDTKEPTGGNSLLEISTEWRYPLEGILSGVFFVEAGNVWSESFNYNLRELHFAAGFGLRLSTPIGPVRFDIGRPIFESKKDKQYFLDIGHAF